MDMGLQYIDELDCLDRSIKIGESKMKMQVSSDDKFIFFCERKNIFVSNIQDIKKPVTESFELKKPVEDFLVISENPAELMLVYLFEKSKKLRSLRFTPEGKSPEGGASFRASRGSMSPGKVAIDPNNGSENQPLSSQRQMEEGKDAQSSASGDLQEKSKWRTKLDVLGVTNFEGNEQIVKMYKVLDPKNSEKKIILQTSERLLLIEGFSPEDNSAVQSQSVLIDDFDPSYDPEPDDVSFVDGVFYMIDYETEKIMRAGSGKDNRTKMKLKKRETVESSCFIPEKDYLIVGSNFGRVFVYNMRDFYLINVLETEKAEIVCISFQFRGNNLLYGDINGNLYVNDINNLEEVEKTVKLAPNERLEQIESSRFIYTLTNKRILKRVKLFYEDETVNMLISTKTIKKVFKKPEWNYLLGAYNPHMNIHLLSLAIYNFLFESKSLDYLQILEEVQSKSKVKYSEKKEKKLDSIFKDKVLLKKLSNNLQYDDFILIHTALETNKMMHLMTQLLLNLLKISSKSTEHFLYLFDYYNSKELRKMFDESFWFEFFNSSFSLVFSNSMVSSSVLAKSVIKLASVDMTLDRFKRKANEQVGVSEVVARSNQAPLPVEIWRSKFGFFYDEIHNRKFQSVLRLLSEFESDSAKEALANPNWNKVIDYYFKTCQFLGLMIMLWDAIGFILLYAYGFLVVFRKEDASSFYWIPLLIMLNNVFFLFYETLQINSFLKTSLWWIYFLQISNWFDQVNLFFGFAFPIVAWTSELDGFAFSIWYRIYLFFAFMQLLFSMRIIASIRKLLFKFIRISRKISSFMLILVLFMVCFTQLFYQSLYFENDTSRETWYETGINTYGMFFAQFELGRMTDEKDWILVLFFLISTIFLTIILFNLLIGTLFLFALK